MPSQDALDNHQAFQLSEVTLSALQLPQQPFGTAAPDAEIYTDDTSVEQLADVRQALVSGDDLLLILGETGSGKSTLLDQLGLNSGQNIQCFAVRGSARFSTMNLFAGMLEAFKRKPPEQLKDILDELVPCLQTMVARNTLSAIILDDADQISEDELTQLLSGMLYINSQDQTLMRVALAAPPAFEDRIPDLLPEGADLPYSSLNIEGMDSERAAAYLSLLLQQAGYEGELPFNDDELDQIVEESGGLPAEVQIAAASLLNQVYDPESHPPPAMTERSAGPAAFMQTRNGKLALGALAVLLILAGLLMSMPGGDKDQADAQGPLAENGTTTPVNTRPAEDQLAARQDASADSDSADSETDETSAEAPDEDSPRVRIIEERKLVPFSSDAIESLVPEIATPSGSADATTAGDSANATDSAVNGSASSANDNGAGSGDGTGTAAIDNAAADAQSAPDSASQAITDSDLAASADAAADTVAQAADSASSELSDELADAADSAAEAADAASQAIEQNLSDSQLLPGSDSDSAASADVAGADSATSGATIPAESADSTAPVGTAASESSNSGADSATAGAATSVQSPDTADVDPVLAEILESPTWILVQDANLTTVQMSASHDRPSIESFLRRNRDALPPPNSIYTFQRNGETWYALLHGLFDSFEQAQRAVEQMPDSAVTDQPWIRNVGRVQDVLKAQ